MNWTELANAASAAALVVGLNGVWLGLVVAVAATILLRAMRRANAATRYAVWFTALLLILATPAFLPLIPNPVPATAAALPVAPPHLAVPVAAKWPMYAALAWLAISAILLARVAWSVAHIVGLKRRAEMFGARGGIRLLASAEVNVPMAAGFIRRAIIFPGWLLAQLTPAEFEQVLSHEMAHLRRHDDWTQLCHAVAQALIFFNPAVYWIGKRLKIEREMACDDWVVSATGQPRPYAACLTHLHELTRQASAPQLAAGLTARRRWQISARVEALLKPNQSRTPRLPRSGWMAAGALASAALLVAVEAPQFIRIEPPPVIPIRLAQLKPPAAPVLTAARATPPKTAPFRRRMLARVTAPRKAAPGSGYVLVRAWSVEAPRTYLVITVVFFEPPPPVVLNRT